jgi:hypothetical protein
MLEGLGAVEEGFWDVFVEKLLKVSLLCLIRLELMDPRLDV